MELFLVGFCFLFSHTDSTWKTEIDWTKQIATNWNELAKIKFAEFEKESKEMQNLKGNEMTSLLFLK